MHWQKGNMQWQKGNMQWQKGNMHWQKDPGTDDGYDYIQKYVN